MHPLDETLERILREWVESDAAGRADIEVEPAAPEESPPRFKVKPRSSAALPITLWVADDGAHIGFSIGGGSWWSDHIVLDRKSVRELLGTVAAGRAGEEVRRVGGCIVARRGYVELGPEHRLTYGQLSPFAWLPGLKWERIVYQPY